MPILLLWLSGNLLASHVISGKILHRYVQAHQLNPNLIQSVNTIVIQHHYSEIIIHHQMGSVQSQQGSNGGSFVSEERRTLPQQDRAFRRDCSCRHCRAHRASRRILHDPTYRQMLLAEGWGPTSPPLLRDFFVSRLGRSVCLVSSCLMMMTAMWLTSSGRS